MLFSRCRISKIGGIELAGLHADLKIFLPEEIRNERHFEKTVNRLRIEGSRYAFIAKQIGLGSLGLVA